ncbi:hypothetical protein [Wenyingzhuangia sp. IMCC45467]
MVEVFITNIKKEKEAKKIVQLLEKKFLNIIVDYDMNETGLDFPCGHTVIRTENTLLDIHKIIATIQQRGIICEIMKDKICN